MRSFDGFELILRFFWACLDRYIRIFTEEKNKTWKKNSLVAVTCDPVIQRMSEILIGKCRFNGAYIVQWIFVYREVVNTLCKLWMGPGHRSVWWWRLQSHSTGVYLGRWLGLRWCIVRSFRDPTELWYGWIHSQNWCWTMGDLFWEE